MKNEFKDSLVVVKSMEDVPFDKIHSILSEKSFACVRGLFSPEEIRNAREKIKASFDSKNDKKHDPNDSEAIRANFQKLQVGGTRGANSGARFLRIFYNPTFAEDIYGMHDIFRRLIIFRNNLNGMPSDFTVNGTDDGMWSASRISHYPRGGGFMAPHTDVGTNSVSKGLGLDYVQLILTMSKKGVDFKEGGAYIIDDEGKRYFFEDECELGDIVIYDGRIMHGVEEIDPMEPLDMNSFEGRHVAFVTLFKHFSKDNSASEYNSLMK